MLGSPAGVPPTLDLHWRTHKAQNGTGWLTQVFIAALQPVRQHLGVNAVNKESALCQARDGCQQLAHTESGTVPDLPVSLLGATVPIRG